MIRESFLFIFFLSVYKPLGGEKVLSFHIKEKYPKPREILNILKSALRWSNRKGCPLEGNLFKKPLHPPLIVFLFLKRDALLNLAKAQVEVATVSLKCSLLSVERPGHCSHSTIFWESGPDSRYSVYILGGSVCAPKTFIASLFQAFIAFPSCSWNFRWQLSKET